MNSRIKLSIAIITYNRSKELKRAVESCLSEERNDMELVIWDNNSDNGNKTEVEHYCSRLKIPNSYFYSETNLGVAGGRNEVWKRCSGEYVFFLDDDAVVESKDFFTRLIGYMDKNQEVGAASVNIYEPETGIHHNCPDRLKKKDRIVTWCFVGGAHILRRSVFALDYLYPANLHFGAEEMYASFWLWNNGYQVNEVEELTVLHLPGLTNVNRCIGKERDKNFLVNQFIIKSLVYPNVLKPFTYLAFRIKLKKHLITYGQCKKMIEERKKTDSGFKVSISCLFKLVHMFGIRPLI